MPDVVTSFTDLETGYLLASDEQGYRDASVALVSANQLLTDLGALVGQYQDFFAQANAAGYQYDTNLLDQYAMVLQQQDQATLSRGTLQAFVDRYRVTVLGSGQGGLSGLGILPVLAVAIAVGITAVAAALGYFLKKHYDLAAAQTALGSQVAAFQAWLGQQAAAGTLDPATVQSLSASSGTLAGQVNSGGSSFLGGLAGGLGSVLGVGLLALGGLWLASRRSA